MAVLATTDAFYPARPNLKLDGESNASLADAVLSMTVHENTDGLYRCEATIGNWGIKEDGDRFIFFDRQVLDFGRSLSVEMGNGDAAAEVFDGRITAIEGRFPQQSPPEILILAEDKLQDLRMVRRSRSFENITVSELIQTIAGDYDLNTDIDVNGPSYTVLTQVNQSDLAFIRQCARDVDAEIWFEDDTLYAQARSRRMTDELSLNFGHRLLEFSVTADLAQQRTSIVVSGWDVAAKEAITHSADDSVIQTELNEGIGGAELLQEKFGERIDRIVHEVPHTTEEATNIADATYRRMARRFLCGQGLSEGDGRLRAGTHVELNELGPLFSGKYYVCEVTHSYDVSNGYRTYFRVERPDLGTN